QNIRVIMPDDVNNYESLAIENDLDKRVEIKNAKVLIRDKGDTDGEGEEVSSVKPNVNGQNVALKLTGAELQQFAGQDVNVQIVSQVGEDAQAGDAIVHEPTVEINEEMEVEVSQATVTAVEQDETEEEVEEKEDDQAETETDEETEEVEEKEVAQAKDGQLKEQAEKEKSSNVKEKDKSKDEPKYDKQAQADKKAKTLSLMQPQASDEFEVNDYDYYRIYDDGYISQFDGSEENLSEL